MSVFLSLDPSAILGKQTSASADEKRLCSRVQFFLLCVFVFVSHSSTLSPLLLPGSHNCSDKLCDSRWLPGKRTLPECVIAFINITHVDATAWARWNVSYHHRSLGVTVIKRQLWVYFLNRQRAKTNVQEIILNTRSKVLEKISSFGVLKGFLLSAVYWIPYFLCRNTL